MAVAGGSETKGLELSLNKATNPLNNAEEWEEIQRFCSEVNKELEGPQYATRLLSHKIQSPQEWEAMQGLTVLEVCMRNCGARFHAEVGKYRFLNELIKVLSPKYLGARSTAKVKNKIVELMYSWTVGIANETKIQDAYKMLKRQGVIQQDPKLPDDNQGYFLPPPPPPRPSNPLFEDEEKSKLLSRLLKSGHPDDLDAANRLIKTMVKEDQTRMEKITKRIGALKSVEECTHTLSEMVARHRHVKATTEEFDSMKEVYKKCERLRPTLFKLASDTDDNDDALADILRANDGLTSVMEFYKSTVEGQTINGDVQQSVSGGGASLLDLEGLEVSSSVPIPSAIQLDTELMGLGLNDPLVGSPVTEVFGSLENSAAQMSPATESEPSRVQIGGLAELEQIGRNMLQKSIPACTSPVTWSSPPIKLTLRELQSKGESHSPSHSTTLVSTPAMASPGKAIADISLANVFVPLESIKPSQFVFHCALL
uniref:Uncharacterized protein n=1 Tax=Eptatretus burgeri TaxID=7764 RepID=A0A8C4NMX5_EPTBU